MDQQATMMTKRIGDIDFEPTVLALGCWAFGGSQWGGQDDDESRQAIEAALAAGITHFDTARGYGGGHSEEVTGAALRGRREQIFLATKVGAGPRDRMLAAVDKSLEVLETDYIDLYYIHWPRKDADLRETMAGLCAARDAGKIRGIGVSNFSIEQMRAVMAVGRVDAHQLCYNAFWRFPEREMIPFCNDNDIAVVTYSSIAQGILTGKFGPNPTFAKGDDRAGTVFFEPDVWPHLYQAVEQLKAVAQDAQRPLAELAIRWVMQQPGIDSVLVGARNARQVERNVAALNGEIAPEIFERITAISDAAMKHVPDSGNIWRYYP